MAHETQADKVKKAIEAIPVKKVAQAIRDFLALRTKRVKEVLTEPPVEKPEPTVPPLSEP